MTATSVSEPPQPELSDYFAVIRRRLSLIVAVTLLVTVAGLVLAGSRDEPVAKFTATTEVMPPEIPETPDAIDSEVEFVRSDRVESVTLQLAGLESDVVEFDDSVVVSAEPDGGVLRIAVTASDADTAQLVSTSMAEAYLQESEVDLIARRDAQADLSAAEIAAVTEELRVLSEQLASSEEDSPEFAEASSLIVVLQNQLTRLRTDASSALLETVAPGMVLDSTTVETSNGSTIPGSAVAIAAFAFGLLVAIGAAFAVDRMDPSIRSPDDAQHLLGNVIGEVPFTRSVLEPGSVPQAIQQTAIALRYATAGDDERTAVILAGVLPDSWNSQAIANLAVAHLGADQRTILLSITNAGTSDLDDESELDVVGLLHLTYAPDEVNEVEQWLDLAAGGTAFVHCRPILSNPDACDLAGSLGALVLIVRVGSTRRDDLVKAAELAQRAGVERLWTVVELAPRMTDRLRLRFQRLSRSRQSGESASSNEPTAMAA